MYLDNILVYVHKNMSKDIERHEINVRTSAVWIERLRDMYFGRRAFNAQCHSHKVTVMSSSRCTLAASTLLLSAKLDNFTDEPPRILVACGKVSVPGPL